MRNRLLTLLCALSLGTTAAIATPPVLALEGGREVSANEIEANQVVRFINGGGKCTGVAIDPHWVLTALHCKLSDGEVHLHTGIHYQHEPPLRGVFDALAPSGDIALIYVEQDLGLPHYAKIAKTMPKKGDRGTNYGWGIGTSSVLKFSYHRFQGEYQNSSYSHGKMFVSENEDGAKNRTGDSGGPLFFNGLVTGITSSIGGTSATNFSSVPAVYDWIVQTVNSKPIPRTRQFMPEVDPAALENFDARLAAAQQLAEIERVKLQTELTKAKETSKRAQLGLLDALGAQQEAEYNQREAEKAQRLAEERANAATQRADEVTALKEEAERALAEAVTAKNQALARAEQAERELALATANPEEAQRILEQAQREKQEALARATSAEQRAQEAVEQQRQAEKQRDDAVAKATEAERALELAREKQREAEAHKQQAERDKQAAERATEDLRRQLTELEETSRRDIEQARAAQAEAEGLLAEARTAQRNAERNAEKAQELQRKAEEAQRTAEEKEQQANATVAEKQLLLDAARSDKAEAQRLRDAAREALLAAQRERDKEKQLREAAEKLAAQALAEKKALEQKVRELHQRIEELENTTPAPPAEQPHTGSSQPSWLVTIMGIITALISGGIIGWLVHAWRTGTLPINR